MHRTIKAITVAGAIAIGSLATSGADAQVIGWNIIRPTACFLSVASDTQGQYLYTAYVYTDTFTAHFVDPVSIDAVLKWCYDRSAFWGNYNGTFYWDMIWVTPGMK